MRYNLIETETGKRVFSNTTAEFDMIRRLQNINPGTQIACMHTYGYVPAFDRFDDKRCFDPLVDMATCHTYQERIAAGLRELCQTS